MQADGDAHDTPDSSAKVVGGVGAGRMVHAVPFHDSARVTPALGPPTFPTAMHADAALHDTLTRELFRSPGRSCVRWMCHAVPFQVSARVRLVPGLLSYSPTAAQAVGAPQDTPTRKLDTAPVGFGVGWTVQPLPADASASVWWVPEPLRKYPTVMHAAEPHETLARALAKRVGAGMVTIDHAVPFQDSPRVAVVMLPPGEEDPTATHEAADWHDTPT